jgi:hypothetical protein
MAWPKIVYTPDGQTANTLTLTYPPSKVPAYSRTAVRHDNFSSAGLRESILERIDDIWTINVPTIAISDVLAWQEFFDYALTGGSFSYFPDGSKVTTIPYVLEDLEAALDYKAPGLYSAKFKVRKYIL